MKRLPARLRLVADRDEPLLGLLLRRGGVSEETARAAIDRGGAFLRGRRAREPLAEVRSGDRVEVALAVPEEAALTRERILHLDEVLLAVDKPPGIAAQEDLAGSPALPALCSALLREMGEKQTQALLVHRLDRGTSGVTALARTRKAQAALLHQFREHLVRKRYLALVAPAPASDEGSVDAAIGGRPARTRWRVVERYPGAALVEALPETGRTHQVRIHLASLGSPLLGDRQHGGKALLTLPSGARHDFPRPMLHARSLGLRHPAGGDLLIEAPPPPDFPAAQRFLRPGAR
ncbi:MAG TPA: RluA family pseudouridine synthase [Myxococcales bacterium]|nr:RluA family pseudouridine synthase [Myxococcales bacterium]